MRTVECFAPNRYRQLHLNACKALICRKRGSGRMLTMVLLRTQFDSKPQSSVSVHAMPHDGSAPRMVAARQGSQ